MTLSNSRDFLINSVAKLTQCRRCQGWIYVAHVNGFETKVEPNPLKLDEEVALRLTGSTIYQTLRSGAGFELQRRTAYHIEKADPREVALAVHDCTFPTLFEPIDILAKPKPKEPIF